MPVDTKTIFRDKAVVPETSGAAEKCRRFCRKYGALPLVALFIASWYQPRHDDQVTRLLLAYGPIGVLMLGAVLTAEANQKLARSGHWRKRPAHTGKLILPGLFCRAVLHGVIAALAFQTLLHTRHPSGALMIVLRLASGTALLYAAAAFIFEIPGLCCLRLGDSLPMMHRTPLFARSIGEFWARRWNITVSVWLHTFVFRPLARRGYARAGVFCVFAVSGFFHAWPMLAALGLFAALSTMAFFLIQGACVLIENRLRVHAWPVALARTWTVGILLASSPLFIDPGLRVFGF